MDERVLRGLATFSGSYAKRLLEGQYDRAFATSLGQKLRGLPKGQRHGIEAVLAVSSAVLDQTLDGEAPLKRFLRDLAVDVAPETSKRLLNPRYQLEELRASRPDDRADGDVLAALFELEDDELGPTVDWLLNSTPEEKQQALQLLESLSSDQLARILRMQGPDRDRMLQLVAEVEELSRQKKEEHWLAELNTSWENWINNWSGKER